MRGLFPEYTFWLFGVNMANGGQSAGHAEVGVGRQLYTINESNNYYAAFRT